MDAPYGWNALDEAIYGLARSTSELPEVFRRLTEGHLFALMPYHPEMEGAAIKLENGSPCHFVMVEAKEGESVALFTSLERAEESLAKAGVPPKKFLPGAMTARQMLEVLGKMNIPAILNSGCATGAFVMPPDLMRDLASGVALQPKPIAPRGSEERTFRVIDPADYPTDLIQPLFECLRRHREFLAAWVLRRPDPTAEGGTWYEFILLMQPRNEEIVHDFNLVLASSFEPPDAVSFGLIDENDDAYIKAFVSAAAPFYSSPGFRYARLSPLLD